MQINKMVTISKKHVQWDTCAFLELDIKENKYECLRVVKKGNAGYYIYIHEKDFETYARFHGDMHMPNDLRVVIRFAIDIGCDVLCLDKDGEILPYLPYYEYEDLYVDRKDTPDIERCYVGGDMIAKTDLRTNEEKEFDQLMESDGNGKRAKDFFV